MRPNLLDLPTEVLTTIFSYSLLKCTYVHFSDQTKTRAWTRQRDLHALCLTNRRISNIAQRVLLGDMTLDLRDEYKAQVREDCSDFKDVRDSASLLLRSCLENPHLQHRIKHIEVTVNKIFSGWYGDIEHLESADDGDRVVLANMETHVESLLTALSLSPSLISLNLDFTGWFPDLSSLDLARFPPDCFDALNSLEIHGHDYPGKMPAEILLRWCTLPRLKFLTIGVGVGKLKGRASIGSYKIESLRVIDLCFSMAYKHLIQFVIPELRTLTTLELPMVGCKYKRSGRSDRWHIAFKKDEGSFSPREIGSCLAPMVHGLRNLSIVSTEHIMVQSHDGSVLDLSKFSQLQKLRLSAYFFMGSSTLETAYFLTENLVELLPASLQEFDIILNGMHGLFYGFHGLERILTQWSSPGRGQEEAEELFNLMWRNEMKSHSYVLERLRWITDLLVAQPVQLPQLTRFLVSEGTSPRPFMYCDLVDQFPLLAEGSSVNVQILQKIVGQCRASDLPEFFPPTELHEVVPE